MVIADLPAKYRYFDWRGISVNILDQVPDRAELQQCIHDVVFAVVAADPTCSAHNFEPHNFEGMFAPSLGEEMGYGNLCS